MELARQLCGDLCRPQPPGPDINGDGQVNFDDVLIILFNWGRCPPPPASCPADIAPPQPRGPDGQVNFDDILLVLGSWT